MDNITIIIVKLAISYFDILVKAQMSTEEHKICMNLTKVRRVYGERAEYIEVGLVSIIFSIFLNFVHILDHYHKSPS